MLNYQKKASIKKFLPESQSLSRIRIYAITKIGLLCLLLIAYLWSFFW